MVKAFVAIVLGCVAFTLGAVAQNTGCAKSPSEAALDLQKKAQAALAVQAYARVVEELKPFVATHPEECELGLILGQAYMYSKKDHDAETQLRSVLARDAGNRTAKLELARVYGYHARYRRSNHLYRELLNADPSDEGASIGLVRNLIETENIAQAKVALKAGLAAHPNSLRLQDYQDELSNEHDEGDSVDMGTVPRPQFGVQDWTYIITDSAEDNNVENLSFLDTQLSPHFFVHLATRVRHLSSKGGIVEPLDDNAESENGPTVGVVTFQSTARLNYHIARWLTASGGVGGIRFNNGTSKALFRGGLEVHRGSSLYLSATYLRTPVLPTQEAETFHLTAQGWRTSFDWSPPRQRLDMQYSDLRYSDTNRRHQQYLEWLRWYGEDRVGFGSGVILDHLSFDLPVNEGYFSPSNYQNYMATVAARVQHYRHFRGEYKFNIGAESLESSEFRYAYELAADNSLRFGKWDIYANYTFDHDTQSTGAFETHFTTFGVGYTF
ncbi:MAG: tetratricopeptide repeat protein [Acidobacteriaceae bacterium]